ncbi:MAG: nitrogen fixation protein NifQ [Pseudomonadota bacterium]
MNAAAAQALPETAAPAAEDGALALAFAGVLVRFGTLCLSQDAACGLALHHDVTGADADLPPALRHRADEVDDVRTLLLEFAQGEAAPWLASTVAVACLGDNHLWQDLGLPSRAALSQLLRAYFPALVARNHGDMKWKKFLYKELCDRAQVLCRAPSCAVCSDYAFCFGPEEGPALPPRD